MAAQPHIGTKQPVTNRGALPGCDKRRPNKKPKTGTNQTMPKGLKGLPASERNQRGSHWLHSPLTRTTVTARVSDAATSNMGYAWLVVIAHARIVLQANHSNNLMN